jgi:hypothetical protein
MYASPQVDTGYDISNYSAAYPEYGTMADMESCQTADGGVELVCRLNL